MSPKEKNEMEVKYQVDSFVDTFWENCESGLARFQKYLADSEDAYVNGFGESRKVLAEQRGTIETFIKDIAKKDAVLGDQSTQLRNVVEKMEELTLSPMKFTFELMDKVHERLEENSREFVTWQRERRNTWSSLTNSYFKAAKNNHRAFWRAVEDTVRPFVWSDR
ncbi:hypothetical protein [Effusibacillus consociatus]|uniref:Uncharacterized protein n=1 Tax=Effusibacillus consociatus TaxID=1117041 RepID=A0ABV9Q758_9BACL